MAFKPVTSEVGRGPIEPGGEQLSTVPLRNRHAFRDKVTEIRESTKEADARWVRDNPTREPGTSTRTWKSFSRVKYTSAAYRAQYDHIDWSS